jgi:flavin reductase (DIM6/NTAB) family NADH-FMN oxidoreductase RutF
MIVTPTDLSHKELYNILISAVAPRPIAWVSTVNPAGVPSLAPFSFFNVVCADPPLLGFSPALRNSSDKDTLRNIRETSEFVVNIVTYELAEAMNLTSGDYDASINEFELAKLTAASSEKVRPPRVAESPVSFECALHQILDFSPKPTSGSLVIGEVISIHINDANLKDGRLDRNSLDLIGRMGGLQYARTTLRFEMVRPKVE